MVTYEQLESNKFVEGVAGPKSTLRTSLNDSTGAPIDSANPLEVTGTFVTTLEQIETPLQNSTITVTATVTNLIPTAYTDRKSVVVSNNSVDPSAVVYIGKSDVTALNGTPLEPKEKFFIDLVDTQTIYGITATGTSDVRILELK